jgi:hypothetical protein
VQAVKRNIGRFPKDFMFQLTAAEWAVLRSRIVIPTSSRGGRRFAPHLLTEQGAKAGTICSPYPARSPASTSVWIRRPIHQNSKVSSLLTIAVARWRAGASSTIYVTTASSS